MDTPRDASQAPRGQAQSRLAWPRPALDTFASRLARPGHRTPGRRVWWAVAALVAVACVGVLLLARPGEAPEGLFVLAREPTVVQLQGDVALWRQPAREAVPVAGATALQADDRIQTGGTGRAAITWPHGLVATLDPLSGVILLPPSTDGVTRLQLTGGGLWLDSGPRGGAAVELLTPEGARIAGHRFQARRDANGRLLVATADLPAVVFAADGRQDVPAGATSEVLPGRRPALARPAVVPPALAVAVEGPVAWVLVDRYGRAVGAPPDSGAWLTQIPLARGPLPQASGTMAVLPDPHGEYQILLWAGEATRPYRVTVWSTDGQALFAGPTPGEAPGALRLSGEARAGSRVALEFAVQDRLVTTPGRVRTFAGLPAWLRLAVASGAPASPAAASVAGGAAAPEAVAQAPAAPPAAVGAGRGPAGAAPSVASASPAGPSPQDAASASSPAVGPAPAAPAALDADRAVTDDALLADGRTEQPADQVGEPAEVATAEPAGSSFGYSFMGVPRAPGATPTAARATPVPFLRPAVPAPLLDPPPNLADRAAQPPVGPSAVDASAANASRSGAPAPAGSAAGPAPSISGPLVTGGAMPAASEAGNRPVGLAGNANAAAPGPGSNPPAGGTAPTLPGNLATSGAPGQLAGNAPPGQVAGSLSMPPGQVPGSIPPGTWPSSIPPGMVAGSVPPGGIPGSVPPGGALAGLPSGGTDPAAAARGAGPSGSTVGAASGAGPLGGGNPVAAAGAGVRPGVGGVPASAQAASSIGGAALQSAGGAFTPFGQAPPVPSPQPVTALSGTSIPARGSLADSPRHTPTPTPTPTSTPTPTPRARAR